MKKRPLVISLATLLAGALASAQGFSISVIPALELPMAGSTGLYSSGAGAELLAIYGPGDKTGPRLSAGAGYRSVSSLAESPLSLISLTGGAGYQLALGKLGILNADLRAGGYFGTYGGVQAADVNAAFDVGYQFPLSPGFSLGVGATGSVFFAKPEPVYSGLGVNLVATFTPGAKGSAKPLLQIGEPRFEPIFPVFFKWYDSNPSGSILLINKEKKAIKNVRASILIKEFMESPRVFVELASMAPGESKEVAVTALLNDSILGVTESTKVAAEISVSYDLADGTRTVMRIETIRVLDRNAMTWDDDRRAASFVTARDPAILALSKTVAAGIRERRAAGGDLELQIAMGLYQALGLYGMEYVIDPSSSYSEFSKSGGSVDYLQFPRQTLSYKSGDCDDLSILYASLLESIGIEAAFITVPGHILVAFALGSTPEEIQRMTSFPDRYIVEGGKVFVPVEATLFSKGFYAAWAEGARQWRQGGKGAKIIPVRDAWKSFEAVGLRETPPSFIFPQSAAIIASYRGEFDRFVSDELGPQVVRLKDEIKRSGSNPKEVNRLGVLYARYGKYSEAEAEFLKILKKEEYIPALVNLGNVAYLGGNQKNAAAFFDRALKRDPKNKVALSGAIRARGDLGDTGGASAYLLTLQSIDPAAALALAHSTASSTGRASDALAEVRLSWED